MRDEEDEADVHERAHEHADRESRRGPNNVETMDSTSRATEKMSASTVATAPIMAD